MVSKIDTAMLLAAGLGTRLRPLTDNTPKPLINVGGTPMLIRSLRLLKQAGLKRVVVNTHYLPRLIEDAIKTFEVPGLTIHLSYEPELLETGGGIKKALPLLGAKPFLVVNSDAVWLESAHPLLNPLMDSFNIKKHDVLMAVVPTTRTSEFRPEGGDYIFDPKTKKLQRPAPKKRGAAGVVYSGIHVTHPDFISFETADKFSLVRPWQAAEAEGRLQGHLYDAPWVDMGSHTGLHYARELASLQKA
ncbi:MAG TPA: nucleotidyltransferase family protein [Alphaproteobacteria bacterium]|nr:nucleotidyltransferase family protein [Alphaproteobacteria bacterium]